MISNALNGSIDLILTKEVSRFARNTVDTLAITRELRNKNVGVIFINDNISTLEPSDELRLSIMATIAQEESRKTSERVRWGQRRQMECGKVFGRDLLGYTVKKGKLYIKDDEVDTVRLIFCKYAYENKGTYIIANELNDCGIKPKRADKWSSTSVLRILKNEKYKGDLCQQKTYTPDYLSHCKKINKDADSQVYITDHHMPIIDHKTWDIVQSRLKSRAEMLSHREDTKNRYRYSGKIICGECGQNMVRHIRRRKDGSPSNTWICSRKARFGNPDNNKDGCINSSVNETVLCRAAEFCTELIKQASYNCCIHNNDIEEIIDKMIVYKNHTITVILKDVSRQIELSYRTSGKGERYHADIELIGEDEMYR